MPGISNDSLVYGVLDLIRKEIRQSNTENSGGSDPLTGTPSVVLRREHPDDEEVLTNASLFYPSGWRVDLFLELGMSEEDIESALEKNNYAALPRIEEGEVPEDDTLDEYSQLPVEEQSPDDAGTGTDDDHSLDLSPALPEDIKDSSHPDFEFYAKWRLSAIHVDTFNAAEELSDSFSIRLIYDYRSFLTGTLVVRI